MSSARHHANPGELGLLVLLGLLSGVPYALTKIALTSITPLTLVAARVTVAAAVLWLVVVVSGHKRFARAHLAPLLVQACLACVIPYTLITFGQQSVGSALTAILHSTAPLFVCIISLSGLTDERATP
jgi:drug/metabolite transporter (DMT)-like permease